MPTYLSPGVYVEEVEAGARPIEGVGTAVAAFVGFAARGPFNTPTLVSNWAQYTQTFGDFVEDCYLAQSVYGYFLNGGSNCYVVRIGGERGNGSGNGAEPTGPQAVLGNYRVQAKELGAPEITVEVADAVGENQPEDRFTLLVRQNGRVVETHNVTTKRTKDNVLTVVQEKSNLITIEETSTALAKPDKGAVTLKNAPAAPPVPRKIAPDDYVGDVADRTGFGGLEAIENITMVAVPDLMSSYQRGLISLESVKAVQLAIIAHCELMGNRMAILDPPPDLNPQQVRDWRQNVAGYDSKYAALYYPWIKIFDPASDEHKFLPPSGYMAGVWARTDGTRGVHKAPANEVVRGAVALETQLTKAEQELLNPIGVNCVRSFPGRGIRVWGARTLSSDPAWRYLNVRRLFNYLEDSILIGTQWVVFEPNDDALWARIRRTISSFLVTEWRKGALFGLTPDEAFYVKCDRETNPAESIDLGQVVCEVGIAPVKPAEFVIFRLAQISGGTSLVNE
ncbi:phage tail sheath subtilisin-like domain-containing protein [Actinosynnema sp. NPDC047251]|uniref:Tail sheath like protein n=1 Tax=Saccharothrix espanaensis (strain ATCC 51144 / DSM 44229 / JCM 9112 / NBRC 15066 / NRRL 15764) TaxID=1179773 RepID=K0K0I4_SACES|nr:phage tail sheath subtilisin-like domain-containing protein [Saccharothrix espanaensis]CCH33765.1 Tail sheath like protein [Saccharothrix espanaensis DSM 44229]